MQSPQEFIGYILCILGFTKTDKPIKAGDDLASPEDADILKKMKEMGSPSDVVIFHETCSVTSTFLLVRKCPDGVFRPLGYVAIPPYFSDEFSCYSPHIVINFVDHDTQTIQNHIVGFEDGKIDRDIKPNKYNINKIGEYTVSEFCGHLGSMKQIYPPPADGPVHIEWLKEYDAYADD